MLSASEKETIELGVNFSAYIKPKTVVFMMGDLGAGKTTFVKGVVIGLKGNMNDVSSPTYVYVHEYDIRNNQSLIHIDLYRTEKGNFDNELYAILEESNSPVIIEWPSKIGDNLMNYIKHDRKLINITIKMTKDNSRDFIIEPNE